MRATGGGECGVDELVKTTDGNLSMGIQDPVSCTWTGTLFVSGLRMAKMRMGRYLIILGSWLWPGLIFSLLI